MALITAEKNGATYWRICRVQIETPENTTKRSADVMLAGYPNKAARGNGVDVPGDLKHVRNVFLSASQIPPEPGFSDLYAALKTHEPFFADAVDD